MIAKTRLSGGCFARDNRDMLKKFAVLGVAALVLHSASGQAAPFDGDRDGWRWGPELGGGFSYLSESGVGARSKTGAHLDAGLQLAMYRPKFVFDVSAGGVMNFVRASDASVASIFLTAFRAELGLRYRTHRWQFGPALAMWLGPDVSLAENADVFPDRKSSAAIFAGLRVMREANFWDNDWRWGAYALTDLNLSDRQVFLAGLQIAWELPFDRPNREAASAYIPPAPAPVPVHAEPQIARIVGTSVLLNLDSSVLNFELNLAVLPPEKLEIVRVVGYFLRNNPSYWESVRVQGHADVTGNQVLNLNLSEARAQYVRDQLVAVGLETNKFTSRGFGSSQPIDRGMTPEAHARNRRVEIYLDGARQPEKFVSTLNRIINEQITKSRSTPTSF
jgi:outer membrane protein OmpA-like peptidoglycan-associated protein